MTVYVSPLGYDSTRVTRPVLSEGIDDGDQIVILRPEEEESDSRASEAIDDVERMIKQVQPAVVVETRRVPPSNYPLAVMECSRLLTSFDTDVVVNFGGGPREVYLALATAALAHPEMIAKALQFSDLDGSVEAIQLPRIAGGIPTSAAETLEAIVASDGGIGIPELATKLDSAKSTVSRHVRQLENADAVEAEMHGKTKFIRATFSGELRAQMASKRRD